VSAAEAEHIEASSSTVDVEADSLRVLLERTQAPHRTKPSVAPDSTRPIFIHALWRSGSTYVWSRFRAAAGAYGYYEPLHDGLSKLTAERIGRDTAEAVAANSHPALNKPYLAEFEPLLDGSRGVRNYSRRLAYHRFALEPDAEDPALEAYLGGLIGHAREQGRQAVLGFNRSDLRIGWMRRKFPSFNLIVEREPVDVFASYLSNLARGNAYYFEKLMLIAELNASNRIFAYPNRLMRTRNRFERIFAKSKPFYRAVAEAAPQGQLYALAFHTWIVRLLHALSHGDLVVDMSLADQPGYHETISERIEAGCGLRVDLQSMRTAEPSAQVDLPDQAAIERDVLDCLPTSALEPFIDRARISRRLGELSPRKAALVERLL